MTTFNSRQLDAAAKAYARIDPSTKWEDCDVWAGTTEEFAQASRDRARSILEAAGFTYLPDPTPPPCINHQPVQHRDGKPPWCKLCGLTGAYTEPTDRLTSASCTTDGDGCEPE